MSVEYRTEVTDPCTDLKSIYVINFQLHSLHLLISFEFVNKNVLASSTDNELCSDGLCLSKHEKSSRSNLYMFSSLFWGKVQLKADADTTIKNTVDTKIQKLIYRTICNWCLCEIHTGQSISYLYTSVTYISFYTYLYICVSVCVYSIMYVMEAGCSTSVFI